MANDTQYGLASYFYTRDLARAWRVSEALEHGIEDFVSIKYCCVGGIGG